MTSTTATVHKAKKHDSGIKHVSGRARYIDDVPEPAGTLHVVPGLAAIASGQIKSIDLDPVKQAPGVIAVLTVDHIRGVNDTSPGGIGDDPVFAEKTVTFHGQALFAVVATNRLAARKAARLAKVVYEADEAPIVSVADARKVGSEMLETYQFLRGEPVEAIKNAPHRLKSDMKIGGQEHFYLEGQIAMAIPGEDGDMTVLSSTQHPTEVQHVVAHVLHVPQHAVTVETRRMGGGFGGKESQASQWAAISALAAQVTGKACKLRLDRDDDMIMTGKRHDFEVSFEAGFEENGRLTAVDTDLASRCGHSADLSLGVNDRAMFHSDNAYFYPDVRIKSHRLRTNTVSATAFRGFGGPQGVLFAERMMDEIAIETGLDPLDVRKANFYGHDSRNVTPFGMVIEDNIIDDLVTQLEKSSHYRHRRTEIDAFNQTSRFLKKGIALTPVKFGIAFTLNHLNQAGALVHVYTDGSVYLTHAGTEMGQGLYIKVAQVVAEEFGIGLDQVKIGATVTDKVPNTGPTAASSGSDLNGMAAKVAADQIKARMRAFMAERFQAQPDDVVFAENMVSVGDGSMKFSDLAQEMNLERISLSASGFYRTPKVSWNRDEIKGRPFFYFAYGAACSEVQIDTMTGEMKVTAVDILHDVGKSLNPAVDIGQIEGGFVQGMGWLTTEELVWDEKGRLRTHAPSTYKIPCASDVPEHFVTNLYDSSGNQEDTIYRSKAVGEPPLMLGISVFSAVYHAIASIKPGAKPQLDAPATPEAILSAIASLEPS
ncbi:xanthine dehydrogenase molybdopterin binding subunit [Pararhizobium sp. IMCC21322]|uniref:xanthine dehydrogenase molybdopterin binding subunit n=1 Tax=Pararhizobium sp. IMCC21322 TaxID=3067903 RepID=UPI00274216BC|nr:xanthine dehydrogenase molybdopterin binding subunit [Pararhizobium sp. IMCC21322]